MVKNILGTVSLKAKFKETAFEGGQPVFEVFCPGTVT
jgi:hypothetical protein